MSYKLVLLAAVLSAVAFAAPMSDHSESVHLSPKVTHLKKQFNELQLQLKSGVEITPAVASTIQKMIDMVTNDIEPTITEAHDADQAEINTLMKRIKMHNDFTESYTAQLLQEAEDLRNKMHEHNEYAEKWKQQGITYKASIPVYENTYFKRSQDCCTRAIAAVEALEYVPAYYECDFTNAATAPQCVQRADQSIQAHTEKIFADGKAHYDKWHKQCNDMKQQQADDFTTMDNHDDKCDSLQAATIARKAYITTEKTRHTREWHTTTTTYEPIYDKLRKNYTSSEVVMWEREETRKLEWNATQLIKCVLEAYEAGGTFNEASKIQCLSEITDYHLNLAYPDWVCQLDYNPVLPAWPAVTDTSPWKDDCQTQANPNNTPMETCAIPKDKVQPECSNHIDQNNPSGDMTPAQALALHMEERNNHQKGAAGRLASTA